MTGDMIIFVQLEGGKIYHAFTYRGAKVPDMQFFNRGGKPVVNPCGMLKTFSNFYDMASETWDFAYEPSERLAHRFLGANNMSKHILKLVKERDDLGLKISKLKDFMKSDEFCGLNESNQELLKVQKNVMKSYKHILNERIMQEA